MGKQRHRRRRRRRRLISFEINYWGNQLRGDVRNEQGSLWVFKGRISSWVCARTSEGRRDRIFPRGCTAEPRGKNGNVGESFPLWEILTQTLERLTDPILTSTTPSSPPRCQDARPTRGPSVLLRVFRRRKCGIPRLRGWVGTARIVLLALGSWVFLSLHRGIAQKELN